MAETAITPTSWLEIDRTAYKHNVAFIRGLIGPDVCLCSVIKGNGYGHGVDTMVDLTEAAGIKRFGVFSADEAFEILKFSSGSKDIMIMGMINKDQLEWAIAHDVSFYIFNRQRLQDTIRAARVLKKKARIHLELETGMNRTGIPAHELDHFINEIIGHPDELEWEGLCTHYAGAESIANYLRIKKQFVLFQKTLKHVKKSWPVQPKLVHTACSAAVIRYPPTHYDLVRVGILQYGFFPSREVQVEYLAKQADPHTDPLKRLISWKTRVMDVKSIKTGEFVGYGTSYLANSPMRVAIVPVGYSNGFSRSLSNQGRVLIRGYQARVVGKVNMNMIQVNITDIPDVYPGDEVVLIGRQGEQEISVSSFSEYSDQVNYEMLTRLPRNIPRKIIST